MHLLTADLLRRHELRLLEQLDVLLPGKRHAEWLGELANRRAARTEPFGGRAAGRRRVGLKLPAVAGEQSTSAAASFAFAAEGKIVPKDSFWKIRQTR